MDTKSCTWNAKIMHTLVQLVTGEVKEDNIVPVLNGLSTKHEGVWGSGCFLDLGSSWR
jgi:hypothetical protein